MCTEFKILQSMATNEKLQVIINGFSAHLKSPWSFSYSSSQVTNTSKHWLITFSNSSKAMCISRRVPRTWIKKKQCDYCNTLLMLMTAADQCNKKHIHIRNCSNVNSRNMTQAFTINPKRNIIQQVWGTFSKIKLPWNNQLAIVLFSIKFCCLISIP